MSQAFAPMMHGPHQIRWQAALLWSGVLLLVVGFIVEHGWHSLPLPRAFETLLLGAAALGLAALLGRLLRCPLATALAGVFVLALACFAGVLPIIATLLLIAGGLCLGRARSGGCCRFRCTIALYISCFCCFCAPFSGATCLLRCARVSRPGVPP
jgi:hypothetical protein